MNAPTEGAFRLGIQLGRHGALVRLLIPISIVFAVREVDEDCKQGCNAHSPFDRTNRRKVVRHMLTFEGCILVVCRFKKKERKQRGRERGGREG